MNVKEAQKMAEKVQLEKDAERNRLIDEERENRRREIGKFRKTPLFTSHVKAVDAYIKCHIKEYSTTNLYVDSCESSQPPKSFQVWNDIQENPYHGYALQEYYLEEGFDAVFRKTEGGRSVYWELMIGWE